MKKRGIFLLLFSLILLILPLSVFASTGPMQRTYLGEDEVVEGNYYALGESVQIDGDINGDLIALAGIVSVNGSIAGDIIAGGGQVIITGPVQGDIRVAGGNVTVSSVVGKNASIFAGNLVLMDDAAIAGTVDTLSGNLEMRGRIKQNLQGMVGSAFINGDIDQNVYLRAEEIEVRGNAEIGKDLFYQSSQPARILSGAQVMGEVHYKPHMFGKDLDYSREAIKGSFFAAWLFYKFTLLISLLILGFLSIRFFPGMINRQHKFMEKNPWKSLGWGLVAFIVIPLVSIALLFSIIGWPLAFIGLSYLTLASVVGTAVLSLCVGQYLLQAASDKRFRKVSPYWSFVFGAVLFILVSMIPIIGWLIKCLAVAAGTGAFILVELPRMKK